MQNRTANAANAAIPADPRPVVREITPDAIRAALRAGWSDFLAMPSHLGFVAIFYPLFGVVMGTFVLSEYGYALVFPLVAGFALVGPVAAVPLLEVSRRREAGLETSWIEAISALKRPALLSIALVALLLLAVFAAWMSAAQAIFAHFYATDLPAGPLPYLSDVLTTARGWGLIVVGHAVGFVFAAIALAIGVVSLPLLVERDVGAGVAVRTSIAAVRQNPRAMATWGAVVAGVLMVASLPLLVGLVVAMPVLGHATWHLYRRTIDRASVERTPVRG